MKKKSFQLHLDGIGPVCFRSSLRARRLSISVIPFQGVRVSVPAGMSLTRAEQAVRTRKAWIEKHRLHIQEIEKKCRALQQQAEAVNPHEARKSLILRLNQLAERHGFSFNRISIRRQQTRWGSCSAANNISLNIKLTLLPDELRDFIIVHELVHTKVKNHGKKFWDKLEAIIPRARFLDQQLKSYSGLLFLP
ncbi:MAG: YgjP-like metallopeptidase domain-containing protein [Pseudomonadota bacterium]|nr:YgjP-like metallopeptidase domain-containing protein [Pseudomonadota bacterium]